MTKPSRHFVDYHLILALYYPKEARVSPDDLAKVWQTLSVFDPIRVSFSFRTRNAQEIDDDSLSLSSSSVVPSLMGNKDDVVYFAASSERRDYARDAVSDSDLNFSYHYDDVRDGEHHGSSCNLSLSNHLLAKLGHDHVLELLREVLSHLSHAEPVYGLVDLARPQDAIAGAVYGTCWPMHAPLARWYEQEKWYRYGIDRGDCVRSIYWGNYFGPKILARLGGKEQFLERYRPRAGDAANDLTAHIWDYGSGVFVSLSNDPLDCRPGGPLGLCAQFNLFWLVGDLGPRGILSPWG